MPARSGDGLCDIIGGKVFVTIPNIGDGGGVHHFYSYDPARNLWSHALRSTPVVHKFAAGGAINGKFYLAGGVSEPPTFIARLDIYDPETDTWTNGAPLRTPRCDSASAVPDGKLYVIGGEAGATNVTDLDDVEIYDPRTDHWSSGPRLRAARRGAGAVVVNRTLYVVGGYGAPASSLVPMADLDALGADGTWIALLPMPQPVGEAFVAAHDGTIYVAGGQEAQNRDVNILQAYSVRDRKWTILARMPERRWSGCGAQWINGDLYVFGGWTHDPALPHDTVFAYDPRKNSWRQ
jgi:N-acetylneuraminic acid mutarotase